MIVFATDKAIKLLSANNAPNGIGEKIYSELRCTDDASKFIAVKFADDSTKLLVAYQGGVLKHMEVCLS